MAPQNQESRTERLSVALTPSEKFAVDLVLRRHPDIDGASNLLRQRSLADVLAEGEALLARLEDPHSRGEGEEAA